LKNLDLNKWLTWRILDPGVENIGQDRLKHSGLKILAIGNTFGQQHKGYIRSQVLLPFQCVEIAAALGNDQISLTDQFP